jgi:hypothetical protein
MKPAFSASAASTASEEAWPIFPSASSAIFFKGPVAEAASLLMAGAASA